MRRALTAGEGGPGDGGLSETLRVAVERTLSAARSGTEVLDAERRADLLDELVRRGRDARDELAKRGQEAGAELQRRGLEARDELSRRGQGARDELSRRLELLEGRLASIEDLLRSQSKAEPED